MKKELKVLAENIKTSKKEFRSQQSKISKEKMDSWGTPEERDFFSKHWKLDSSLNTIKFKFRHMHIAYCLLKGRTYEQIEPKVREHNEPNWDIIKEYQNEYSK